MSDNAPLQPPSDVAGERAQALPSTSSAPFALPSEGHDPLVDIDLDRYALTLQGIETTTCVQCGVGQPGPTRLHAQARWGAQGRERVNLIYGVCPQCQEEEDRIQDKVRAMSKAVRTLYYVQWGIFLSGMLGGFHSGAVFTAAVALFLGTWAGSSVYQRILERGQPKLLDADGGRVRLRARRSWVRVLRAEHPQLLAPQEREDVEGD